jgi:hypothetical protein
MECKTTNKDMIRGEKAEKVKPIKPENRFEKRPILD